MGVSRMTGHPSHPADGTRGVLGSWGMHVRVLARALCVVAVAVVFGLTIGSSGSAQVAISDQTIDEHTDGSDIQFAYPRIGLAQDDAMLQDFVNGLLSDFKSTVAARLKSDPKYFAQLTYSVSRNDEQAVVVIFEYDIDTGGAHPNTTRTAFNFLMPDGARVFLPDLIGADGIQRVSDIAVSDLTSTLLASGYADPDWIRTGAGPHADNFDIFEWLPSEVLVHFDAYAVASYAQGPQEVHIPMSRLQAFIRPDPRAPLPSFDCAAASTDVENAICSDQALAQLDRRVG